MTRLILSASAIVLVVLGLAATFAPHEIATALALTPAGVLPLLIQLLGATLFALAMINWMARGSLIGGIYNRPVAVGNVAHFVIGALAATKAVLHGEHRPIVIAIAALYVVFAIAFGMILMRSPVSSTSV